MKKSEKRNKALSVVLESSVRPMENPELQHVVGAGGTLSVPDGYEVDDDNPPDGNP